jgi:hypothetical protein
MDTIIQNIQAKLDVLTELKYIDEDWGQLDYYAPNFPVKWPCVLIDVSSANYSDIGIDKTSMPRNRQQAEALISLTIANLKLSNTNIRAPQTQKDNAFSINGVIEKIHQQLHGWNPADNAGKLIRRSRNRIKRDDGVQEYTIIYSFSLNNV